jgi:hypothetical protein
VSEEQKQIAWNVTRACFWLLAFIIVSDIIMAYVAYFGCFYAILTKIAPPNSCDDNVPDLKELLVGGLAIVLAFAGNKASSGDK